LLVSSAISPAPLAIIEPKLRGPSGHYAEFVRAIAARAEGAFSAIEVAADARAAAYLPSLSGVVPVVAFGAARGRLSEIRALHAALTLRRGTLVMTAKAVHAPVAELVSLAAPQQLARLALLYHWTLNASSDRMLLSIAPRVRRRALFLATTSGVAAALTRLGCARVVEVAYPATRATDAPMRVPFRHLLMAGAARINKGLELVAGLAESFAAEGRALPLVVQVSPKHVDRHGSREDAVVARLLAARYSGLVADPKAPDRDAYAARFAGALVLAPYDPAKFADSVSGVVLDALLHGAPVITSAGTWAATTVSRFDAGIVLSERTPVALMRAVDAILDRWDFYAARAAEASDVLVVEHDPQHVVRLLASGGS
jgi:hypothetical protein